MNKTISKCISEKDLIRYYAGLFSGRKRSEIERHLAGCDVCLDVLTVASELERGKGFLKLDPVPSDVTKQALHAVMSMNESAFFHKVSGYISLFFSRLSSLLSALWVSRAPAFATVRGSKTVIGDDLVLLKKTFPDMEANIEIEKKGKNRAWIKVHVTRDGKSIKPVRITLFENGREVASHLSNGSAALFEDIPFGRWVLKLSLFTEDGGVKEREYPFEIKETPHER